MGKIDLEVPRGEVCADVAEITPLLGSKKAKNLLIVVVREPPSKTVSCFPVIVEKEKINVGYLYALVSKAIREDSTDYYFRDHRGQFVTMGPSLIGSGAPNPEKVVKQFSSKLGDDVEIAEKSTVVLTPMKPRRPVELPSEHSLAEKKKLCCCCL